MISFFHCNHFFSPAKCKPGTYSFDGYEPCHLCPRGFYSSQEMQTECKPCDDNTTTMAEGAGDKNNCIDVGKDLIFDQENNFYLLLYVSFIYSHGFSSSTWIGDIWLHSRHGSAQRTPDICALGKVHLYNDLFMCSRGMCGCSNQGKNRIWNTVCFSKQRATINYKRFLPILPSVILC